MAKRDIAAQETDDIIYELEKKLEKEYRRAEKELQAKLEDYLKQYKEEDNEKKEQVESGDLSRKEYEEWRLKQIILNDKWKDTVSVISKDLSNIDMIARSTIKGYMPKVYAVNSNFAAYEIENGSNVNISWSLYNAQTVERLWRENPKLLPDPVPKTKASKRAMEQEDMRWNRDHMQSELVQGILQGESIDQLSDRMEHVIGMDRSAAVRNARTMCTGAMNAGRLDQYKYAESLGINVYKQWDASKDGLVRESHAAIDGEVVALDEDFSNGCGYPGDPGGAPEEVYNCRCVLLSVVKKGSKDKFGDKINKDYEKMSYADWLDNMENNENEEASRNNVVEGKDISETWKRRPDEFNSALEDVIDAQGFDGLPKVVSADEFEKAVQENNIICARGYTAPDKETLAKYQHDLYYGDWYVTGEGMFAVGEYGSVIPERLMQEVSSGYGANGIVETFTLDHAKIINHADISAERARQIYELKLNAVDEVLTKEQETLFKFFAGGELSTDEMIKIKTLVNNKEEIEHISNLVDNVMANDSVEQQINELSSVNDGVIAAIGGYDAMQQDLTDTEKYFIILNRTKIIFKG